MKILLKTLFICSLPFIAVAQNYKIDEGFYTGFDPTKVDENKFEIDSSVDKKERPVEGKYYGYKFSNGGFFVAPEAMRNLDSQANLQIPTNDKSSAGLLAQDINYNIKANIGYEFTNQFKSFVIYDVGSFSLNSTSRSARFEQGQGSNLGLGSQIKISEDFVVKVTYTQQQLNDATLNQQGRLKDDVLRFGTSINF